MTGEPQSKCRQNSLWQEHYEFIEGRLLQRTKAGPGKLSG